MAIGDRGGSTEVKSIATDREDVSTGVWISSARKFLWDRIVFGENLFFRGAIANFGRLCRLVGGLAG